MSRNPLINQENSPLGLPRRLLGQTGEKVSILGLGGWHIGKCALETDVQTSIRIMHEAIDNGLTFFDNAWDYHNGMSEMLMGKAIKNRRDQVFLMTKNCERDYKGSLSNLEESLRRLRTDYLDLWQFHEICYDNDPDWIFEHGGLRAGLEAQQAGKVRYIGFTGHKDPNIHLKMLDKPYLWASIQMPINVFDWHYRSFTKNVVPICLNKNIGIIGMKGLGGSGDGKNAQMLKDGQISAEELLCYALSQPISVQVIGIRNQSDLKQALRIGRNFTPMSDQEMTTLRDKIKKIAGDGRYELYKTTIQFDSEHHRKQHGFP